MGVLGQAGDGGAPNLAIIRPAVEPDVFPEKPAFDSRAVQ